MRLGPPPFLIPGKRIEDSGTMSEDDGLPCSPPEMSFQEVATQGASYKDPEATKHLSSLSLAGTGSEEEEQGGSSQPPSRPLSPVSRLSPQAVISSPTDIPSTPAGVDFSSPAHHVSCLDNSAARHRMSIKPRNQRASTKGRKQPAGVYRTRSSSMNSLDEPLSEREEEPQSETSTETVHHQSYSSQVTNLEEERTSPVSVSHPSSLSLQDQHESMAMDVEPLTRNDEGLKSGERFQLEGRMLTNLPFLQHSEKELLNADNQHTKEIVVEANEGYQLNTSLSPQSTSPGMVSNTVTDCNVATSEKVELGIVDQIEPLRKPTNVDVSRSSEPFTRPYPIPAPRTKKPALDKISNTKPKEAEKETELPESNSKNPAPFEGLDNSSQEDDKAQRPSSFRFSIASAKYRSKTISGELVTKQDEESSANTVLLKNPSNSQNLELRVEKVETAKTSEVPRNPLSIPDKRSSLRREVIPQNISKTGVGSEDEKSGKEEESEESRGLFGVKLRTTSFSLKYRSDMAKSEDKTKRHSLDAHQKLGDSEGLTGKEPFSRDMEEVIKESKSNVLPKTTPQNSDPQQEPCVDTGSDREADTGSEPAWMSLAREKTRAHQSFSIKPSTQPTTPSPNSTSSSTPSTQQPQRPNPQPRPPLRSTNKSQLRACHSTELQLDHQSSQQTPPKPAPRALTERWSKQSAEKSQLANEAEQMDIKGPPKPGVKNNTQTESDVLRRTQAFMSSAKPEPSSSSSSLSPSSLSHQQSPSDRGQPSWMELAKRKSLAWSDKSLD
ncbi:capping protein inhibiting regulator of actin dynamics isoform X2 [Colossoma macropomum]|nr:capping protein inhibiting regulator of actin dynamics isoform X2 [Colossoma macropomum]